MAKFQNMLKFAYASCVCGPVYVPLIAVIRQMGIQQHRKLIVAFFLS